VSDESKPEASTDPMRDEVAHDSRGATGAFSPPVEDPKDANDPATLLGVREHFSLSESLRALSHWELGVIERVREFRRGSRRSPKLRIATDRGEFLLKRRAPGRDDVARVTLAHELQVQLAEAGYPVAPLISTRKGESRVELDGRIYELFRYIDSTGFPKTAAAAGSAGAVLARLHALTARRREAVEIRAGTFHAARTIESAFHQLPAAVATVEGEAEAESLARTCRLLRKGYLEAARRVEACGWANWPRQLLHGDWHPGNVLFRGDEVTAVLDFDSARLEPRAADISNGLLQFTMLMSVPDDPLSWPDGFDGARLESFLRGYDLSLREHGGEPLSEPEQSALPWLMIEALIVESAVPIAATGSFASIRGSAFLQMVERKVDWIWRRSAKLKRLLG